MHHHHHHHVAEHLPPLKQEAVAVEVVLPLLPTEAVGVVPPLLPTEAVNSE